MASISFLGDTWLLLAPHGDTTRYDFVALQTPHLNTGRGETGEDEHLPIGMGGRDFSLLTAAMNESEWSGTCTHEVYGFDLDHIALAKDRFDDWLAE